MRAKMGRDIARVFARGCGSLFERQIFPRGGRGLFREVGPIFTQKNDEVGIQAGFRRTLDLGGGVGFAVNSLVARPEADTKPARARFLHAGKQIPLLHVPLPVRATRFHAEGVVGVDAEHEIAPRRLVRPLQSVRRKRD